MLSRARLGRRRFLALAGGALAGPMLAACRAGARRAAGGSTGNLPAAPEFTLTLFDGNTFSLTEQRGKLVLLNFWASWCVPCKEEMPAFERLWLRYKDKGVVFVGANVQDIEQDARRFLQNDVRVS